MPLPGELAALRRSVERSAPYGAEPWARRTAKQLGLEFSLHPRKTPKK